MGNRLSKITTKTGDGGKTGLGTGDRVSKTDARIMAIGEVDELNSWIGRLASQIENGGVQSGSDLVLQTIQHDLFNLGGELACPGIEAVRFDKTSIDYLERVQDSLNEKLPALKEFILPGGHREAADAFLARAIARRAERSVWALIESEGSQAHLSCARYLNRLSDFLFVYGRFLNQVGAVPEVLWKHARKPI